MLRKMVLLASLVAAGLLLVMMNMTTPETVGPFGVLVFFTLMYIVSFGVACLVISVVFRKMSARRQYMYGTVVGFGPVMLVMSGAFGGVGVVQVGLVALAVGIGCFLVAKA